MRSYKRKIGVTLVEILIVLAVIVILAGSTIGIATRIDNKAKEQLTENTLAILNAALGDFRDYGYRYPNPDYSEFDFPLDCNDFPNPQNIFLRTLQEALGLDVAISGGAHKDEYSGSEALYFFLSRVPASRKTLGEIDSSLIINEGADGQPMSITVGVKVYPLLRFTDPWGKTLRYDYYNEGEPNPVRRAKERRNFPVITSAGPDGVFETGDDIASR